MDSRKCQCVGRDTLGAECFFEPLEGSDFCYDCRPDGGLCPGAPRNVESMREPTFTEAYKDLTKTEVTEAEAILMKLIVFVRQAKVIETATNVADLLGDEHTFKRDLKGVHKNIIDLAYALDDAVVVLAE